MTSPIDRRGIPEPPERGRLPGKRKPTQRALSLGGRNVSERRSGSSKTTPKPRPRSAPPPSKRRNWELIDAIAGQEVRKAKVILQKVLGEARTSSMANNNVDINLADKNGNTALHLAIKTGDHELVLALQEAGADPNVKNNQGETPLHLASKTGDHELVLALQEGGADPNVKNNQGETPLHLALSSGNLEAAKSLLKQDGVNLNEKDKDGNTLLHLVAINNRALSKDINEVIFLLLDKGLDINAKNKDGDTPMHLVAKGGNLHVLEYLEGSINIQNNNGDTPLHLAAARKNMHAILSEFSETDINNADCNIKNKQGKTPLHLAIENDNNLTARDLIDAYPGSVNTSDAKGNSPLFLVLKMKQPTDLIRCLKNAGVDLNAKNKNKQKALDYAIKTGKTQAALEIIKASDEGALGNTKVSLEKAIKKGDVEVVRALLITGELSPDELSKIKSQKCSPEIKALLADSDFLCNKLAKAIFIGNSDYIFNQLEGDEVLFLDADETKELQYKIIELTMKLKKYDLFEELITNEETFGANVINHEGNTALHLAAQMGDAEFIRSLRRAGADLNLPNNKGQTALHIALINPSNHPYSYTMVEALISDHTSEWKIRNPKGKVLGADKNILDRKGNTPLHYASEKSRGLVHMILGEGGVKTNTKNKEGKTAFRVALASSASKEGKTSSPVSGFLSKNYAKIKGTTPLHEAIEKGNLKLISEILDSDTGDLNTKDADGKTPLALAVRLGNAQVVKDLWKTAKNDEAMTVLYENLDEEEQELLSELLKPAEKSDSGPGSPSSPGTPGDSSSSTGSGGFGDPPPSGGSSPLI